MKRFAPISLTIVFILYFFANIAYFAASKCTIWLLLCRNIEHISYRCAQSPRKISELRKNSQPASSLRRFLATVEPSLLSAPSSR
jgi:hypothetical protein